MPTGESAAMLGGSYLLAMNEDWGVGPSVYGAAKGNYGGLFTVGFTAQYRHRLGSSTYLAGSLYAGAGGGVSSPAVRFGGGLMLRPELAIRSEWGRWSLGLGVSRIAFPSGNVQGNALSASLSYADGFRSYSPDDAGRHSSQYERTGMGFDEIGLNLGAMSPRKQSVGRSGRALGQRVGLVGASLRQYRTEGAWWGVEAAGAASGGADGYMDMLASLGEDYAVPSRQLRLGWQLGAGLAGGGDLNTGNGWVLRAGPTLRWQTPWGPSLRVEAGYFGRPGGSYNASFARMSLSMPLEALQQRQFDGLTSRSGQITTQSIAANWQQLRKVRFKDGRTENVGMLALRLTRELSPQWYGVAHAGSAAFGSAGAYSFGLVGAGLQMRPSASLPVKLGAELSAGAGGGGGIAVSGGAIAQGEVWAEWQRERLRVHAGVGQWRSLRGDKQSAPLISVSLAYAFGSLAP